MPRSCVPSAEHCELLVAASSRQKAGRQLGGKRKIDAAMLLSALYILYTNVRMLFLIGASPAPSSILLQSALFTNVDLYTYATRSQ